MYNKGLFFCLLCCFFSSTIKSELIVVKEADGYISPLDEKECRDYGKLISSAIFKYQWPMCVGSKLREEELAVLTPNAPYAEEQFIEKMLNERLLYYFPTHKVKLKVLFIPTVLYELFCLIKILTMNSGSYCDHIYNFAIRRKPSDFIDLSRILSETALVPNATLDIDYEVYELYHQANDIFFDSSVSVWMRINSSLSQWIVQNIYISNVLDSLQVSDVIKMNIQQMITILLDFFVKQINKKTINYADVLQSLTLHMIKNIGTSKELAVIERIIALEYRARDLNKGLLLRGSEFGEYQIGSYFNDSPVKKKRLVGSTLRNDEDSDVYEDSNAIIQSITPYSISFGNSLFAGFFRDPLACVNFYLERYGTGYGLFINKYNYIQHREARLFFIAPLASIAALFERGEYFHSRTTIPLNKKSVESISNIIGLADTIHTDPLGVLLITRDPLKNAALFADFVAKNGEIINIQPAGAIETEGGILQAHEEAARFYNRVGNAQQRIKRTWRSYAKRKVDVMH